ncbi:MAG: hypothetical protein PUB39_04625 [Eubacteriales bacterium]|nr:hypothetical protein [Eubacteriales bacterium]
MKKYPRQYKMMIFGIVIMAGYIAAMLAGARRIFTDSGASLSMTIAISAGVELAGLLVFLFGRVSLKIAKKRDEKKAAAEAKSKAKEDAKSKAKEEAKSKAKEEAKSKAKEDAKTAEKADAAGKPKDTEKAEVVEKSDTRAAKAGSQSEKTDEGNDSSVE